MSYSIDDLVLKRVEHYESHSKSMFDDLDATAIAIVTFVDKELLDLFISSILYIIDNAQVEHPFV